MSRKFDARKWLGKDRSGKRGWQDRSDSVYFKCGVEQSGSSLGS
jgi:hypothetical protein